MISGTASTRSAAMRRAISLLNSQCGLHLVILVRVKLSMLLGLLMLLGVTQLNKLHCSAANPARRALRRHEDLGSCAMSSHLLMEMLLTSSFDW